MFKLVAFAAALVCALTTEANARRYRHHHGHARAWCGLYMSKYFGGHWAREGRNAGGPGVGVVVVWPRHVGVITGQTPEGHWIVHSGNDGGAVRTRARSVAG